MAGHPVDKHVGNRLRQLRALRGITQAALADQTGVACQQVQKYEKGANRISASRLWEISRVLDVPISSFFEGLRTARSRRDKKPTAAELDIMNSPAFVRLVTAYCRIRDARLRTAISHCLMANMNHRQSAPFPTRKVCRWSS